MDPNFIRPAMTSYLTTRTRMTAPGVDNDLNRPLQPSVASRVRRFSGALLIALGERLTGTPRTAYREPADDPARATS